MDSNAMAATALRLQRPLLWSAQVQAGCAGGPVGVLSWQGLVHQYLGDVGNAEGAAALRAPALDYWALPPNARLQALHRLCHAALDTPQLRCAVHSSCKVITSYLMSSHKVPSRPCYYPMQPRHVEVAGFEPTQPRNILLLASLPC